jgi:hypothetical protein
MWYLENGMLSVTPAEKEPQAEAPHTPVAESTAEPRPE